MTAADRPPRPMYRTGRKVGRTIYVQRGATASDRDRLIGMLDSPDLAKFAVAAMNLAVRAEAEGLVLAEPSPNAPPAGRSAEDERDSLARRLALRFEETEKLRAQVEAHDGELGDLRAQLSAAEAEADSVRAEVERLRAERAATLRLIRALTDPDDCWFDHNGGCQAHGYLSLEPGEKCPQQEAKELTAANEEMTG